MLTSTELLRAFGLPVLMAAVIAAVGCWKRWDWAFPLAAGVGFLGGFVAISGVPGLPPHDGIDWLFWVAIPLIVLGIVDAVFKPRAGFLLGIMTGAVVFLLLKPLTPHAVQSSAMWAACVLFLLAGVAMCGLFQLMQDRVGSMSAILALCIVTGAAAVLVLSSNLRISGIYGLSASAALGPTALLAFRSKAARSVAIVTVPLLTGLLISGRYYADPGVSWRDIYVLLASCLVLIPCALIPLKRHTWVRGAIAVALIGTIAAWVVVPKAMKAKNEAEQDPYADYYK